MASSNHTELQTPSDAPFFVQHLQKNLWPYIDASNIEDGLLEAIERLNSQVKHQDLSARTVRPRHQKPPRQQYVPSYTSLSRKPRSRHVEDSSKAVTWKEILIASMTRFKSRSVNGEPDQNILWTAVKRRTMKPRFTQTMWISITGLQKAQYEHPGFMRDPEGNGKLLLSKDRRHILDWPQLPTVLSSKLKIWAPGKYQSRLNPHIKLEDQFEWNPKDDDDDQEPLPADVEVIIKENGIKDTQERSYTPQPWIRDAIESVMPQTGVLQPYAYQLILVRHSTAVWFSRMADTLQLFLATITATCLLPVQKIIHPRTSISLTHLRTRRHSGSKHRYLLSKSPFGSFMA